MKTHVTTEQHFCRCLQRMVFHHVYLLVRWWNLKDWMQPTYLYSCINCGSKKIVRF